MKTYKHKIHGTIATYKDGVFKQDNCCVEIGVEPSSEFWDEVLFITEEGNQMFDGGYYHVPQKKGNVYTGNILSIHAIKGTNFNNEVKKFSSKQGALDFVNSLKNYEILSFYSGVEGNPFEYIFTKQSNGFYSKGTGECSLEHGLQYWKIYSVKRLSDEKVFTVKDKVKIKGKYSETWILDKIDSNGTFRFANNPCGYCINDFVKVEALFTTEDNVEIFTGGGYWWTDKEVTSNTISYYNEAWGGDNIHQTRLTFAKKENAEKFIKNNKKVFSLTDMVKMANHWAYIKGQPNHKNVEKIIQNWKDEK